ncbi:hypothetical protein [Peribacillus kribbensis]|nr:hypothetical protein [Peribacillus kribbensis]
MDVIGIRRIETAAHRWKTAYKKNRLGWAYGYKEICFGQTLKTGK